MILRQRLPDNYDPELPWVVEVEESRTFLHRVSEISTWVDQHIKGETLWRMRKIGFADQHDAMLFYLRFA